VVEAVDHVGTGEARAELALHLARDARRRPGTRRFSFRARHFLCKRTRHVVGGEHTLERAERIERGDTEVHAMLAFTRDMPAAPERVAQHDGEIRARQLYEQAFIVIVVELRDRSRQRKQARHTARRITFDTKLCRENVGRISERAAA
jgi:hypothetical protein